MQRAIGWAVCLLMAAASTPAFAGDDKPLASDEQVASTSMSATDDAGSGGREPTPQVYPMTSAAPSGEADAAAQAAHEEFVAHIWNSP